MSPYSSHKKITTVSLAGWLFADLLLGLWALFMIIVPAPKLAPSTPTISASSTIRITPTTRTQSARISPTFTLTPTPTPTRTLTPTEMGPVGLSEAQCYNIELGGTAYEDGSERQAILTQITGQIPNNEDIRAGLILVWGHGIDIYGGRQLAKRVGLVISEEFPLSFGIGTEKKSLGYEVGRLRHVQIEVYFFTTSRWKSGREVKCEFTD